MEENKSKVQLLTTISRKNSKYYLELNFNKKNYILNENSFINNNDIYINFKNKNNVLEIYIHKIKNNLEYKAIIEFNKKINRVMNPEEIFLGNIWGHINKSNFYPRINKNDLFITKYEDDLHKINKDYITIADFQFCVSNIIIKYKDYYHYYFDLNIKDNEDFSKYVYMLPINFEFN